MAQSEYLCLERRLRAKPPEEHPPDQVEQVAHRAFITRFGPSGQADGICGSHRRERPCLSLTRAQCLRLDARGAMLTSTMSTGAPSTASYFTGLRRRTSMPKHRLSRSMRACGSAIPFPTPVDPRRSRLKMSLARACASRLVALAARAQ